jgi:hypothetical protein
MTPSRCVSGPLRRHALRAGLLLGALGALGAGELLGAPPGPEAPRLRLRAHAHNDYEHPRPLQDALELGFGSVEADIHLVDGRLLVAHDLWQVKPERTLEALYLEPLRERVRTNAGRVVPGAPTFWLLIDLKSPGATTWPVLRSVLEKYRPMLTVFGPDGTQTNAVSVVLNGNVSRALLAAEPVRLAALEGRPEELEANPAPHLVPWVGESWNRLFTWRGAGPVPEADLARLRELVARAHDQGRQVRFWAAPDFEPGWRVVLEAGVDRINTDRLTALAQFLDAIEAARAAGF